MAKYQKITLVVEAAQFGQDGDFFGTTVQCTDWLLQTANGKMYVKEDMTGYELVPDSTPLMGCMEYPNY